MKKQFYSKLLFLFALLLTVSTTAWAEEVSFIFTGNGKNCEASSGEVSGISFETGKTGSATATAYNATNGLVLYGVTSGGGYFQTTEPVQGSITQIVVTTNKKKNNPKYSVYGSTNGTDWTQIGDQKDGGTTEEFPTSADYTYIKIANTTAATAQLGINSIVITYTPSGAAKADNDFALVNAPIELNFDLYDNYAAQVISYTSSSTGAVTIAENEYIDTDIDADNKTITVTPKKKTPSSQTITVDQAADDDYKAGKATFTVSIEDNTPVGDVSEETIIISDMGLGHGDDLPTFEGKAVTLTWDKGTNSNTPKAYENGTEARFYKGNTLTFTAVKDISMIEFTYSQGYNGDNFTASTGTVSEGKWTGDAKEITLTNGASGSTQIRFTAITITYANESDTRLSTTTTIDGTGITNTNVFSDTAAGQLVATVSAEENVIEGAAITWSGNNDEVATIAADGTVTLVAAGEVTFTATYEGDDNHKGSTATYKMTVINKDLSKPGATAENPYTVAQAIEAIENGGDVDGVYVEGIISQVDSYSSQYSSITYWISEDGTTANQLQVYSGKGLNGANFSSLEDVQKGDKVVVSGKLKKYNDIYEFDYNNELVSRKPLENPTIITAYANATWVAPANVKVSEDVTVYTVEYIAAKSVVYKHEVSDNVVPANAAVLLTSNSKGAATVEVEVAVTDEPANAYEELKNAEKNDLLPSDGTVQGENIFCLADGDNGLGFYPVDPTIKVPAGKAYLLIPAAQAAPSYLWFNGDTTAIDSLTTDTAADNESGEIYSLTGQRVGKNYRGIVIMNGRKVLKK